VGPFTRPHACSKAVRGNSAEQVSIAEMMSRPGRQEQSRVSQGWAPRRLPRARSLGVTVATLVVSGCLAANCAEGALTGLEPGITRYDRVLASDSLGTSESPQHTFAIGEEPSFALPDGRAWEMVSPPEKEGAPVEALTREGGLIRASEDGNALTYVVDGALGEEVQGNRSPEWQQVIATRSASGWRSKDIATPSSREKGVAPGRPPEYQFFSPNLSAAIVEPAGRGAEPPLAPGVTQATIYLRDNVSETFLPLVTEGNVYPGTVFGGEIHFVDATPDIGHAVITSNVGLQGPESASGLYEWTEGGLQLASILPEGLPATGLTELGFFNRIRNHAISSSGSRLIFTKKEENTGRGRLYLRDMAKSETVEVDAAQGVSEPERGQAQFQGASTDESRIFFTDTQRLTADSTAKPGFPAQPDLYECDIFEEGGKLACQLRDLTVDDNKGEHANVQGLILGASEDATRLFFVAQGVLASNENGNADSAEAGGENMYELRLEGARWTTTFVAQLSSEDSPEWEGNGLGDSAFLTAGVSPSGRYLAFMSAASPTGYDNVDASAAANGAHDEEVYLYDSTTSSLRCVSCNPSGERPSGVLDENEAGEGLGLLVDRRKVWLGHYLAGNIPGWTADSLTGALFQSRYLSDDGRLYFNSPDALVPAAENGKENVYEFEPSGVGGCESPSGGCVSLLSSGTSDRESAFIEATPSGGDIFFITQSQLLPQDTDTAFDIYDARECTVGSPCLAAPEPPPPGCGSTEACRPAQLAQQLTGGPSGSAAFSGPGNPALSAGSLGVLASKSKPSPQPKRLTRAQKLKKALRHCRKHHRHNKRKRNTCERAARRRYAPHHHKTRHTRKRTGRHPSSAGAR
jgi:hypothetical protein